MLTGSCSKERRRGEIVVKQKLDKPLKNSHLVTNEGVQVVTGREESLTSHNKNCDVITFSTDFATQAQIR